MGTVLRLRRLAAGAIASTRYSALRGIFRIAHDEVYGGALAFTGTLRDDGLPVLGRVRVFNVKSGMVVRQTWSNPATGAYTIPYLNRQPNGYDVILYSPTYATRAHVFRNIDPE